MKKALILASVASMIDQFNMYNIEILQNQGYIVDVMANFEDGGTINNERLNEFKKELTNINVEYIHIPFNRNPLSMKNIEAYKKLKKLIDKNEYDLVHMHSPIGGLCGRLVCKEQRKNRTKVIYTAHGFHFYKGAPIKNWIIYYPLEKYLARFTDILITINQEDYNFSKKKLKAKKIYHINGVGIQNEKFNIETTEQEKENLRKDLNISKNDIVLTYVAELNKNKNQILLIKALNLALKQKENIKLLLVGKVTSDEKYENILKQYNIENNVKLLGYRTDIKQILDITDIYVASSIREGLGLNVIEAMYNSLPIIATDNRGHRELVINRENGYLINIDNVEEFANRIIELLNDEALRKKYGQKSKNLSEKYTDYAIMEKMKYIYEQL